jgi:hypothetical protein
MTVLGAGQLRLALKSCLTSSTLRIEIRPLAQAHSAIALPLAQALMKIVWRRGMVPGHVC